VAVKHNQILWLVRLGQSGQAKGTEKATLGNLHAYYGARKRDLGVKDATSRDGCPAPRF